MAAYTRTGKNFPARGEFAATDKLVSGGLRPEARGKQESPPGGMLFTPLPLLLHNNLNSCELEDA